MSTYQILDANSHIVVAGLPSWEKANEWARDLKDHATEGDGIALPLSIKRGPAKTEHTLDCTLKVLSRETTLCSCGKMRGELYD